jgi:hypothetical protein
MLRKISFPFVFALAIFACSSSTVNKEVHFQSKWEPLTVGNHSYLPILVRGTPNDSAFFILDALNAFEQKHPDFQVTGWKVEKDQYGYDNPPYIYGLWIDHKPK